MRIGSSQNWLAKFSSDLVGAQVFSIGRSRVEAFNQVTLLEDSIAEVRTLEWVREHNESALRSSLLDDAERVACANWPGKKSGDDVPSSGLVFCSHRESGAFIP